MCKSKFATQCRFNPIENSATLTASFAKHAGIVGTAEYNYLVSLRNANPGLVVLKATHASPTPKTDEEGNVKPRDPFAKVSYKAMEDYISLCRTKDAYQQELKNIRLLSKGQPVPYLKGQSPCSLYRKAGGLTFSPKVDASIYALYKGINLWRKLY